MKISEVFAREWEKPCWVVAIHNTLGTSEEIIKKLAKKAGWDGKSFGVALHQTIQVAWDILGKMPDLTLTKTVRGMTPKQFSMSSVAQGKTGMVFTKQHVMPMVNGKVSNYNGHGDEEIIVVATYESPSLREMVGYLGEIDHDDEVYSKRASQHVMSKHPIDDSWTPLMTVEGDKYFWKQVGPEFRVVMKDQDTGLAVLRLELKEKTVKVPGGTLTGLTSDSISSHEKARGKGLAFKLYSGLIQNGQVLFSSNSQTTGSRRLWEQLVSSKIGEVFVLAEDAAARWYSRKYDQHEGVSKVLLTGDLRTLNDEAYASSETRWVIVPFDMVGNLKKQAITV